MHLRSWRAASRKEIEGVGRILPVLRELSNRFGPPASSGGHLVVHTIHLRTFAHSVSMFIQPIVMKTLQCAHHILGSGRRAVNRRAL